MSFSAADGEGGRERERERDGERDGEKKRLFFGGGERERLSSFPLKGREEEAEKQGERKEEGLKALAAAAGG